MLTKENIDLEKFLNEEISDLDKNIKIQDENIENFSKQLDKYRGELYELTTNPEVEKLNNELFVLEYCLIEKEHEITYLNSFLNEFKTNPGKLSSELYNYNPNDVNMLYDNQIKYLRASYAKLSRNLNTLIKQNETMKQELSNLNEKTTKSNKSEEETTDKTHPNDIVNNNSIAPKKKSKLEKLTEENALKEKTIKNLQEQINNYKKTNSDVDKEIASLNELLSEKFSEIINLEMNVNKNKFKAMTQRQGDDIK